MDLVVREPAQPDSQHPERKLTLAVVLERLPAAVRSVTVGFDRKPLRSPQEVDREAAHAYVDLRHWQTVAPAEPKESALEV
jgi:hypothetical protein